MLPNIMIKKIKIFLILAVISTFFIGCQNKNDKVKKDSQEKDKKVKIVVSIDLYLDDDGMAKALEEIQKEKEFANIDFDIKPKDPEYTTKMPVRVASGEQIDIIGVSNPILKANFAESGLIKPLDSYIDELGVDFNKIYGQYGKEAKYNGKYYMVPFQVTSWGLFYNKKIFDEAGIAYPDPNVPMTWDEYRILAKKLTHGEGANKKWGALHLTWPTFWYGDAIMELGGGNKFYNEKGLSNIENPAFSRALKRNYEMMHVDKSIPSYAEVKTSKLNPDAWMTGKYGMYIQGTWQLSWGIRKEIYPRDWKIGIAPMPVDKGTERKNWGVVTGLGIPVTSKHPKEALRVALELTRLSKIYTTNNMMANQQEKSLHLFEAVGEGLKGDGLDKEAIQNVFANPDIKFIVEKVTGKNPSTYEAVIKEEVEKYFIKEQTLETTIKNIKVRGDKAIQAK